MNLPGTERSMSVIVLKRMKLSHQLTLMVLLALVIIIFVQFVYNIGYNRIVKEKANNYIENIMSQVEEKLTTSTRDIKKAAMTVAYDKYIQEYLVTDEPLLRMQLYDTIKNSMNYMNSTSSNIRNIILVDSKNRTFSLYSADDYKIIENLASKYNFMEEDFSEAIFTSAFEEGYDSGIFLYAYIVPIYSIAENTKPREKIGTCILINKTDDIQNTIARISLSEDSFFLIKDREEKIIASNKVDLIGKKYDLLNHDESGSGSEAYSVIKSREFEPMGLQMISVLSVNEVTGDLRSLRNFGVITAIIMSSLMMFISVLFFRNVMGPVSKIADFLESLKDGHLHKRLYLPEANEIGNLANNINKMLCRIDEMTRKIVNTQSSLYEMELSKKQAELSALQSQINPHFLYNTLNCIQSMGLACGNMDIVNISASLIKIFRYGIKGGEIVKVRDEVECIKHYLNIMGIRYGGKFITEIDIDESILDMSIVKMILQPIVENAIYHGLERKKGKGKLTVKGRLEESGMIFFEVTDDGKGIDADTLSDIKKLLNSTDTDIRSGSIKTDVGIGIFNINKRIKLYFGDNYGLEIDSKENVGTSVRIRLPVKNWEEEKRFNKDNTILTGDTGSKRS